MKDAQFWNPNLYYAIWYAMILASGLIYSNIWFWERLVGGFSSAFSISVKYLALAFFVFNVALFWASYYGWINGYWLWILRALSVAVIPSAVAVVMTYVNFQSFRALPEGRKTIAEAYRNAEREIARIKPIGNQTLKLVAAHEKLIHDSNS